MWVVDGVKAGFAGSIAAGQETGQASLRFALRPRDAGRVVCGWCLPERGPAESEPENAGQDVQAVRGR